MTTNEPQSWGEAMKQYETEKRGGIKAPALEPIQRYGRTKFCPLGATRRDDISHPTPAHPQSASDVQRWQRHGYGGAHTEPIVVNTITQRWEDPQLEERQRLEDEAENQGGRAQVPGVLPGVGSNRPMPLTRDNFNGRGDLFSHVGYAPGGLEHDTWVGNKLIQPTKGKKCDYPPPVQAKGRRDLFDVVRHNGDRHSGDQSQDSWIGNLEIHPEDGKFPCLPQFMQAGRRDLYDTMQQTGNPRPGDQGLDVWIGHAKINPTEGKMTGSYNPGHGDLSNMHETLRHQSPPNYDPQEPVGVLVQTAGRCKGKMLWDEQTKDPNQFHKTMNSVAPQPELEGVLYESQARSRGRNFKPVVLDKRGRTDLFGVLQQQENAKVDEAFTSKGMIKPVPGSMRRHKGMDMLHWKDNN
mmetsp:Transcript_32254/g.44743  ORF Transcript_32254/g.44743 Transcript_32254/m.44743 type:complete len:409 (+) Transcript_32254:186-1412(+)|eukprot:CAMPEP_0196591000 /NCGR_PEP_ID=MMETSP1081-20130531/68201_1 /TAXON_ID=36882 /ORGANISM="Pyramimonas amylifera, Strain CCMP720" /LENGTH=408 /DNA_ID=CAMNT_0041914247 /DNA_START=49 /DNA_END=1275 /DNA_ORIENTATION=-